MPAAERGDGGGKSLRIYAQASGSRGEKKELLDRLAKPSGVSDEERMKRAAINQQEPGWEETLTGLPKEVHGFWKKHLEPRGYRVKYQIADWPNGMPGDISITLMWR